MTLADSTLPEMGIHLHILFVFKSLDESWHVKTFKTPFHYECSLWLRRVTPASPDNKQAAEKNRFSFVKRCRAWKYADTISQRLMPGHVWKLHLTN